MGLFTGYDIAITLVAIMLAVSGIILGLGIAIDDRKLKDFGRSEIYQAIINGAIIGVLFLAFSQVGIVTQIINNVVGGAQISTACDPLLASNQALCFSYNYLTSPFPITIGGNAYPTLFESVIGMLVPISLLSAIVGIISSLNFSLIVGVGLSAALAPLVNQLDSIISALTFALVSIEVQGALMKFISVTAVPVILPIGMILRSFYPTRKTGGAMMAIAIGLFAVFPLTYVLDAQMAYTYSATTSQSINATLTSQLASTKAFQGSIFSNFSIIGSNGINLNPIAAITSGLNAYVAGMTAFIQVVADALALLVVEVFFFPIFSVILTIISIRELAKILGSEISFGKFDVF